MSVVIGMGSNYFRMGNSGTTDVIINASGSQDPIQWQITGVPGWLTASATSGTTSASTYPQTKVTFTANSSAPGSDIARIKFTNLTNGLGTETLVATRNGSQRGCAGQLGVFMKMGGPVPTSTTVCEGAGPMSNVPSWLTATTDSYGNTTLQVNDTARSYPVGTYDSGGITWVQSGLPGGMSAVLTVESADLQMSGPPLQFEGYPGGPFTPASANLNVATASGSEGFAVSSTPDWATVTPMLGTTPQTLAVSINAKGNLLAPGHYNGYNIYLQPCFEGLAYTVPISLNVKPLEAVSVALTSSPNPSQQGQAVTFSATVTSSVGTPGGTVTFLDNGAGIGAASLNGGVAVFSTSALSAGSHTITATYGGDSTHAAGATSPALQQTVNALPDPTLEVVDGMFLLWNTASRAPKYIGTTDSLAATSLSVAGTAADGVSRLLIRAKTATPGTVTFSITGGDGSANLDGRIFDPMTGNETGAVSTITLPQGNEAFAVYVAPIDYSTDDFDPTTTRNVTIKANFTAASGGQSSATKNLVIARPPLLLVHGLWSSSLTWENQPGLGGFKNQILQPSKIPDLLMFAADYRGFNAAHFTANVNVVPDAIKILIGDFRAKYSGMGGLAISQVDVVGHSMGGILTRLWTQNAQYNREPDLNNINYNQGNVHKIITLDTPHRGSYRANWLTGLRGRSYGPAIEAKFRDAQQPIDLGAVEDLQDGSGAIALLNAGSSRIAVPAHVIIGYYSDFTTCTITRRWASYLVGFAETVLPGPPEGDDTIVELSSQAGGMPPQAQSQVNRCHTNVTYAPEVVDAVKTLLNTSVSDPAFASFPSSGADAPAVRSARSAVEFRK